MHWVYVLEDQIDRSWYIGATSDIERRITEHLSGHGSRTTSLKEIWSLIYCEGYLSKQDAFGREKFLKSGAGRRFLKKQLKYYLNAPEADVRVLL